ncbi:MAG: hypothetical protein LM568_06455 [Desulfurococcaceae archaeon]|nr:hypothetical protein [Desulfurococcaceae archaeon]
MSSIREMVYSYVKKVVSNSVSKVVVVSCDDVVTELGIAPSTCYAYLRVVCRDIGGEYIRGKCTVVKG